MKKALGETANTARWL